MKHHFTSFVLRNYLRISVAVLLSLPLTASAQQETAFPNEYASWEVGHYWMDLPPGPWSHEFEYFEAFHFPETDTLMTVFEGGEMLGKYYCTADQVYFSFVSNYRPFSFTFDVDNDVYFLLYDFSMEVGDTAYTDEGPTGSEIYYITVDSIVLDDLTGTMLKHFHLSNYDVIIEKTGSLKGLFRPFLHSFEMGHSLCYHMGTFDYPVTGTTYGYSADFCVPSNPNIGLITHEMDQLTAYPNPADDLLNVTASFPISTCDVYSATGAIVQMPTKIQKNKLELEVTGLPSGVYFLELKEDKGTSQILYFMKN